MKRPLSCDPGHNSVLQLQVQEMFTPNGQDGNDPENQVFNTLTVIGPNQYRALPPKVEAPASPKVQGLLCSYVLQFESRQELEVRGHNED